jgi:hypothetical protein
MPSMAPASTVAPVMVAAWSADLATTASRSALVARCGSGGFGRHQLQC